MKKRILSMALCVMMLVSVLPLSAFSTGAADAAACTCTAACTEGAMNAECPVCSAEGATAAQCALHSPAPAAATQAAAQSAPAMTNAAAPAAAVNDSTSAANGGASGDNPAPAANGGAGGNDSTPAANVGAGADDSTSATDGGAASDPSSAASAPADTTEATVAPAADAAVTAAQAQIDALPTAEALAALMTAMNDAEDNGDAAAYAEAEAQFGAANDSYDAARAAYDALTPDQQALINPALLNAFEAFLSEFYGAETLTGSDETPSGTESKVAQIGEGESAQYYDTLSNALNNATDGCTITLLKDIANENTLGFQDSFRENSATIDLNDKKITSTTVELPSSVKALTIKDSSKSKNGSITVNNSINTTGSLTVEGGNVTFTGAINSIEAKGGTLTIASEAPTDSSANVSSLKVEDAGTTVNIKSGKVNIESVANATVNITGGEVTLQNSDDNYAIGGSLKVSGGTLNIPNYTVTGLIVSDNGNVNITGGKVENPQISGGTVNISGGTIAKGNQANNEVDYPYITGGTVNISGGTVETFTATGGTIDVKSGGTLKELNVTGGEAAVTLKGEAPTDENKPNVGTLNVSGGSINIETTAPTVNTSEDANSKQNLFNIKTLNVTGGTATVTSGRINGVAVSGGTLNFNGGSIDDDSSYSGGALKLTGGTAEVKGGSISTVQQTDGTLKIHKEAQGSSSAIADLQYSGGTLAFVKGKDENGNDVEFNTGKAVVGRLYVTSGSPKLTNGVFGQIQNGIDNSDLLALLADGCAIFNKDNNVVSGKTSNTDNFTNGNKPFHIAEHDCDKYNAEAEHNYTKNADGKFYCDCGRECKHTSVGANGKCAKCTAEFFANGKKDSTTEYYTQQQFLSADFKFQAGYTYTLYGDITLGEAALTPDLISNINIVFNLNKHSVSGTINLGNDTHTLGLTIGGEGDLSGAKFVLKDGSALGLRTWTGDTASGKGLTLGGLDMSAVTAANAKMITVHSGMTITSFTGGASTVTVKDWLGGSETGVAPYLMLKNGNDAQPHNAQLSTLSNATVTIAKCENHSVTDNAGTCQYCGHTFVAKLTEGSKDTYFEYDSNSTTHILDKKGELGNAFTAASNATSGSNTLTLLADVNVHDDGVDEDFKISNGTFTFDLNGRKIGESNGTEIRICSNANVTITDNSGNSGNSGYLNRLYVGGINDDQGGTVTIESGNFNFVNPNYGTVNIKGGKTETLNVSNGGVANVSNADDGTIPEITTLNYNSSESTGTVSLQGGKYSKIGYADGYSGSKHVANFLSKDCAYYSTAEGTDGLVNVSELTDTSKLEADSGKYYYVRSHECTPDATGACTCGRVFVATLTTGTGEGATTTYYEALQSALNAAKTATDANVKVTLLSDNPMPVSGSNFGINGGTFTLDLNGKNVNNHVVVYNGNVTIIGKNDGTGTVSSLSVGLGGEYTNRANVTIKSGKFNSIGVGKNDNLTFNGGEVNKAPCQ